MSAVYYKKLQKQKGNCSSSDTDSDSDEETTRKNKKIVNEDEQYNDMQDLFVIDRKETDDTSAQSALVPDLLTNSHLPPYEMDKDLKELLNKAIVGPKFENNYQPQERLLGRNARARLRRAEREKSKGSQWFNMPATEVTDEVKRDLELIQMRSALDPVAHYKRNDRNVLPKYFQVGRVVDAPEDYYSSRMFKKERKKTMVDEILYNEASLTKAKKKYSEIRKKEVNKRRRGYGSRGKKTSKK